jgi:hypothetical protein
VYDHFHTDLRPISEATHEAWSLLSAYAATHGDCRRQPYVPCQRLPDRLGTPDARSSGMT